METTVCNLCGSPEAAVVYHLSDYLLEKPDVQATLVRCQNCGLVYQNPRPTLSEMGAHYPPEYDSYNPDGGEKASWLMRRLVQYGLDKRVRFVTRAVEGGRLLDVGCATGLFLRAVPSDRFQVQGVEVSPHAAEIARRLGLDVFTGTLEQAAFPAASFDAVTLWDVLEHLHDPLASLQEITRILKPGGALIFRVPHGGSWDARLFGRYWAGLDTPRHLYVFDRQTLIALLAKAGLQIESESCAIGSYPTFVLSVRFWMAGRGWSAARRGKIARLLNGPLARLASAPFFSISSLTLNGPVITVTARKRSA